MPQSAELGAGEFVLPGNCGVEVHVDGQPGHRVWLQTQLANIKAVRDVLRADQQLDFLARRNIRHGRYDVIFRSCSARIQSQRISAGGANQFRPGRAEFAVRAGMAEIPGKLLAGDLQLQRPRRGPLEVCFGPGVLAIKSQADEHDDGSQRPDELHRRISFEEADSLASFPGPEYGESEPELREDKDDAGNDQRTMELLVNLFSKVCNWRREPPPRRLSKEEINRDRCENQKKNGQGERDCSRALLSAFSPHLPPLRTIRSRTGPIKRTAPLLRLLAPPLPDCHTKEKKHHIHPLR